MTGFARSIAQRACFLRVKPVRALLVKPFKSLVLAASILAVSPSANAAISLFAEYHLGEIGSLGPTNLPLDSSPALRNFINEINGSSASVVTGGTAAAGSTEYLSTAGAGSEGWYSSGLFTGLATDNFAFGVFVKASSLGATEGDIFTLGGSNGSFKLSLAGNGWAASAHNVAWIGADSGVAGSFVPDAWVHLALIRNSGTTTFFINGVAQGNTFGGTPAHDTPHISVAPGGATYFDGGIDEARVVTFSAGESTPNILNALQVPEPGSASLILGGLALMAGLRRRRSHQE